jgi:predicted nucleic acid-binding Zn ribbon protein
MLALVLAVWGETTCAVCGKALQGRYLQAEGRVFCSPECFRTTLPTCAVCGKRIEGGHLVHEDRHFCSDACFRSILPTCAICGQPLRESFRVGKRFYCKTHAEGPRCDACALPVGTGGTLADGRVVCSDCRPGLVFTAEQAAPHYARAGQALALVLGQPLPAPPPLELVGRDQLPTHGSLDPAVSVRELGRYLRESETTTTRNLFGRVVQEETRASRKVLILYGLPADRFISTAVHELTHDLLAERYPAFDAKAPGWAAEGVCQYTAALVSRRLGYDERVAEIEAATDPVYGAGYRYLAGRFGAAGWTALSHWLDSTAAAALPAQAPAAAAER